MKRCRKELEYMYEKRKNTCRTKIRDFFAQITSLVKDLELKTLADLERQSKFEEERLSKVFKEISQVKENIKNDLKIVDNLMMSDGQGKVECFDLIEKISKDNHQYYKTIDLFGEYMDANIKNEAFVDIKRIVQESIQISPQLLSDKANK